MAAAPATRRWSFSMTGSAQQETAEGSAELPAWWFGAPALMLAATSGLCWVLLRPAPLSGASGLLRGAAATLCALGGMVAALLRYRTPSLSRATGTTLCAALAAHASLGAAAAVVMRDAYTTLAARAASFLL